MAGSRALGIAWPAAAPWRSLAALAGCPIRLDHAGLRRGRPPVLRGAAAGADPPAVAARAASAGIWRSDRCWSCSACARRLARPARPVLARDLRHRLCDPRASIWICGGNLPLVPGDSCHYLEVATSVLRGEGPVKHYVESFFRDYRAIREGQGVLDDWATPLDAYVLRAGLPACRAWAGLARSKPGSRPPRRAASS